MARSTFTKWSMMMETTSGMMTIYITIMVTSYVSYNIFEYHEGNYLYNSLIVKIFKVDNWFFDGVNEFKIKLNLAVAVLSHISQQ